MLALCQQKLRPFHSASVARNNERLIIRNCCDLKACMGELVDDRMLPTDTAEQKMAGAEQQPDSCETMQWCKESATVMTFDNAIKLQQMNKIRKGCTIE